jgi:AcrR family transcriptional regulator
MLLVNEIVQKKSAHSREAILDAAASLVHEQGASCLTLDATCARAGMSKGGLLYHFRSKEDLLLALVDHRQCLLDEAIQEAREGDPDLALPGRQHRALIRAMFGILRSSEPFQLSFMAGITVQLMASGGHHQQALQEKFQRKMENWKLLVQEDGVSEIRSWLIRCVIDGLVTQQLMQQSTLEPRLLEQMEEHLLALAGTETGNSPTPTPLPMETA